MCLVGNTHVLVSDTERCPDPPGATHMDARVADPRSSPVTLLTPVSDTATRL